MAEHRIYFLLALLVITLTAYSEGRNKKLFPVFQVVQFDNTACVGTNSRNGTCYTADECEEKGGKKSGTCANGYGVCCTFVGTCDQTTSENNTYFTNPTTISTSKPCTFKVCPVSDNVCQLRLDFNRFVITGPSTSQASSRKILFNNNVSGGGRTVTRKTQCLTDVFTAKSRAGNGVAPICGTNTNLHMYVEASQDCNELTFQLGATGVDATVPTREWDIKVTQIECNSKVLPPKGCTNYFYSPTGAGTIQTYNYAGGVHLADQDQVFCVRRARGNCRICWTADKNTDFETSKGGAKVGENALANTAKCCNYGANGMASLGGWDCLKVPGAQNANNGYNFCGRSGGLAISATSATVCSASQPFKVTFSSDSYEATAEAAVSNKGVQLHFAQDNKNCNA